MLSVVRFGENRTGSARNPSRRFGVRLLSAVGECLPCNGGQPQIHSAVLSAYGPPAAPPPLDAPGRLGAASAASADRLWLAPPSTDGVARILGTSDGGRTWATIYQGAVRGPVAAVSFPTAEVGYGLGTSADSRAVLRTTDGGVHRDKPRRPGLCGSSGRKGVEDTVDGGQGAAGGGTEVHEECIERECGTEDAVLPSGGFALRGPHAAVGAGFSCARPIKTTPVRPSALPGTEPKAWRRKRPEPAPAAKEDFRSRLLNRSLSGALADTGIWHAQHPRRPDGAGDGCRG